MHLQQVAAQQPQPEVHIRGDKKVNYEYVMTVMAEAQRSGVHQLGFITEPSS
jgi:biopolymer transport protein ExbD